MAIWAVNYLTVKIALRSFEPLTLASFRVVGASAFMLAIYPIAARLHALLRRTSKHTSSRARSATSSPLPISVFSVLPPNQMCFTVGLRYTSVAHSSLLLGMGPIWALILAVLFRLEKLTLGQKPLGNVGLVHRSRHPRLSPSGGVPRHLRSPSTATLITLCGSLAFALYVVSRQARSRETATPSP